MNTVAEQTENVSAENTDKTAKKTFWNTINTSAQYAILMAVSALLSGFLKPKGILLPEYVTLPYALCQFLWGICSLGWFYHLIKEIMSFDI